MGRYARFNTGLEYKFVFGIQPSDDITTFGGTFEELENDESIIHRCHSWSREDKDTVWRELSEFEGFIMPNFDSYEMGMEGTNEIYKDIFDINIIEYVENDKYSLLTRFCLGCLIYHQLSYCNELICFYEF